MSGPNFRIKNHTFQLTLIYDLFTLFLSVFITVLLEAHLAVIIDARVDPTVPEVALEQPFAIWPVVRGNALRKHFYFDRIATFFELCG